MYSYSFQDQITGKDYTSPFYNNIKTNSFTESHAYIGVLSEFFKQF